MKVLIVSQSPYLLCRNSRISSLLIKKLIENGHEVLSAALNHDLQKFPPEIDSDIFEYISEGVRCKLYPLFPTTLSGKEKSSVALYEIIKENSPDIVLSIGNYEEIDFLHATKQFVDFKWVALVTNYSDIFNNMYHPIIDSIDHFMFFSKRYMRDVFPDHKVSIVPSFCDNEKFFIKEDRKKDGFSVVCNCRNISKNKIGNLIKAFYIFSENVPDSKLYLHTNIDDRGYYDIRKIVSIYNRENIFIPSEYCSIKDGCSDDVLNDLYNKCFCSIDVSDYSVSSISMIESIFAGCYPIVNKSSLLCEYISDLNIPYNTIIGSNEIVLPDGMSCFSVSIDEIVSKINIVYNIYKECGGSKEYMLNRSYLSAIYDHMVRNNHIDHVYDFIIEIFEKVENELSSLNFEDI